MSKGTSAVLPILLLAAAGSAAAQSAATPLPESVQIAAAVAPLPEQFRAGARVLGYRFGTAGLVPLRGGAGPYICLASDPAQRERFHVACYHDSLEPFMARGRALRAEGQAARVDEIRNSEAEAGTLKMPVAPAALYSLTGTWDDVDARSGAVQGARALYVIYVPFATAESTGLPTTPVANAPWLMNPGSPKAHIMFVTQM